MTTISAGAVQLADVHAELVASLIEMREACACAMRVLASLGDETMCAQFAQELGRAGVRDGFGTRADDLIAKVRAK